MRTQQERNNNQSVKSFDVIDRPVVGQQTVGCMWKKAINVAFFQTFVRLVDAALVLYILLYIDVKMACVAYKVLGREWIAPRLCHATQLI